jgi:3-deoxy-D-manno-octulosonate 8-phosphate phosphatase (KDO 8-P phosphatase)
MTEKQSESLTTLKRKLKKIRMLLMDVDGVLTDGGIVLGSEGREFKIFDAQDGMGIVMLRQGAVKVGFITGRESEAVASRAKDLHIDVLYQGVVSKRNALKEILDRYDLRMADVCYVGDDIQDIAVMEDVGVAVAVANARNEVKRIADYVTNNCGGRGAIREVVELILKSQGKWRNIIRSFQTEE